MMPLHRPGDFPLPNSIKNRNCGCSATFPRIVWSWKPVLAAFPLAISDTSQLPRRLISSSIKARWLSKDEGRATCCGQYREASRPATLNRVTARARAMTKRPTQFRWSRLISLAGALVLMAANASAQVPEPNVSPWHKKGLTPAEERERQRKLDADYKAATNKIPDQKANDPWAIVRPPPAVPAPNKKQQ